VCVWYVCVLCVCVCRNLYPIYHRRFRDVLDRQAHTHSNPDSPIFHP